MKGRGVRRVVGSVIDSAIPCIAKSTKHFAFSGGGRGFIGTRLTRMLLKKEHEVLVITWILCACFRVRVQKLFLSSEN